MTAIATLPRATVETSIASACKLVARLELPENATKNAMRQRVDEIRREAAGEIAQGVAKSKVLGMLRRRVQVLATNREMRLLQYTATKLHQKQSDEQKKKRRRRRNK